MVTQQVANIYKNPPSLAKRYQAVMEMPLESRLRQSTQNLQNWIALIRHQQKVTILMAAKRPPQSDVYATSSSKHAQGSQWETLFSPLGNNPPGDRKR